MFICNGFTFFNICGQYQLLSENGNYYIETIYEKGLHRIYSPIDTYTKPLVFQFAELNSPDSIIEFCNKYGLLEHPNIFFNITNNYLFFETDKRTFAQYNEFTSQKQDLDLYTTWITRTKLLLTLKTAIESKDYEEMINCCIYFLFHESTNFGKSGSWMFETNQFNKCFFEFTHNIKPWEYYNKYKSSPHTIDLQSKIDEFIKDIETSFENEKNTNNYNNPKYFQIYDSTWKAIIHLFSSLKNSLSIYEINKDGHILYNCNIKEIVNTFSIHQKKLLTNISCCVLTDTINAITHRVRPVIRYETDKFIGDWEPRSLLEAMYFELFTIFSQDTKIKKCPCCGSYFEVSKTNCRKKYCSDTCNDRMAQRRRREKLKKISQ